MSGSPDFRWLHQGGDGAFGPPHLRFTSLRIVVCRTSRILVVKPRRSWLLTRRLPVHKTCSLLNSTHTLLGRTVQAMQQSEATLDYEMDSCKSLKRSQGRPPRPNLYRSQIDRGSKLMAWNNQWTHALLKALPLGLSSICSVLWHIIHGALELEPPFVHIDTERGGHPPAH